MEHVFTIPEANLPPRTFKSLLWKKVLDAIDDMSLPKTFRVASLIGGAACLTTVAVVPDLFAHAGEMVLTTGNGVVWKFPVCLGLVFYAKPLYKQARRVIRKKPKISLIEGIPTMELLDHLFNVGSFKREAVLKKWGLSVARFNKLALRLDTLGVFIRNDDNARILNPEISRQDVAAILEGKRAAADLTAVLKQVGANHLTAEPTATMIEARVTKALDAPDMDVATTSPVFTMRRLA